LGLLTGLNTQLQAATQALGQAQSNKAYTESLLSSQEAVWKAAQSGTNPQALDQQLAQMQDQLAALQARYTDEHPDVVKMKKSNTAGLGSRLHQSQQDEQFQVVDPANLPEKPTFPDWRLFSAGGFVVGFALGIGLSALLEFQDKTLRTEREVEVFLKVPALATLPVFQPTGKKRCSLLDAFRPT